MSNYFERILNLETFDLCIGLVSEIRVKLTEIIYPGRSIELHAYLVLQLSWIDFYFIWGGVQTAFIVHNVVIRRHISCLVGIL